MASQLVITVDEGNATTTTVTISLPAAVLNDPNWPGNPAGIVQTIVKLGGFWDANGNWYPVNRIVKVTPQ